MGEDLPLSALLSQALVAFMIEFDNEFEHRMPHRTTRHGAGQGPWLASMVMWSTCMRFVDGEGLTVGELENLARTKTNLSGMERWRYIEVERRTGAQSKWVIRATAKGLLAREVWRPLFGVVEGRWVERFGKDEIGKLRELLRALVSQVSLGLPDCLPILGYGLFSRVMSGRPDSDVSSLHLAALLSRVLLAFAVEFESESRLSLAICANVVRALDEKGVRIRDIPILSGVSKEAIGMALGVLQKSGDAVEEPDPNARRGRVVRLTPKGLKVKHEYRQSLGAIKERWAARFGGDTIRELRELLAPLAVEAAAPYPDGWRAAVRKPDTLPHFPMVLHRGGFPDGS
jgi:DNA-binding MarR family transcriptional regulator